MMEKKVGELSLVTKEKQLAEYIFTVTMKSPKYFRYTFVTRLQNLSLDIIEESYRANETPLGEMQGGINPRRELHRKNMTDLKMLAYFSMMAKDQGCLLAHQYEQIAKLVSECMSLLRGWIKSDEARMTRK